MKFYENYSIFSHEKKTSLLKRISISRTSTDLYRVANYFRLRKIASLLGHQKTYSIIVYANVEHTHTHTRTSLLTVLQSCEIRIIITQI